MKQYIKWSEESHLRSLVGKKIVRVYESASSEAVAFETAGGELFLAVVTAECCSSTWIEDFNDPDALLGEWWNVEDRMLIRLTHSSPMARF